LLDENVVCVIQLEHSVWQKIEVVIWQKIGVIIWLLSIASMKYILYVGTLDIWRLAI